MSSHDPYLWLQDREERLVRLLDALETPPQEVLEDLADIAHEAWCSWEKHRVKTASHEALARWARQQRTSYKDLPEAEKASDRIWAKMYYAVVAKHLLSLLRQAT